MKFFHDTQILQQDLNALFTMSLDNAQSIKFGNGIALVVGRYTPARVFAVLVFNFFLID